MIKAADWVTTSYGGRGIVKRVAKDGSWADVAWTSGTKQWTKRMKTVFLTVMHTIKSADGWEITDVNRKIEMEAKTND